jgi:hypothetical protein
VEIDAALSDARAAVDAASLPEEWQTAAFTEVLRHLLGGSGGSAPFMPVHLPASPVPPTVGEGNGVAKFAKRVGLDEAVLHDIYGFEGGGVSLHVASTKIAVSKKSATREIALLIVAARQGIGVDDGWTAVSHIREVLHNYNRFDSSNFATNIKAVSDAFNFRGKGASVEIRLTQPGWEIASAFVREIAGTS